jgi:predicted outer membrane protein
MVITSTFQLRSYDPARMLRKRILDRRLIRKGEHMLKVIPITSALAAAMLAVAPAALAQVSSGQDSTRSPWPNVGHDSTASFPGTASDTARPGNENARRRTESDSATRTARSDDDKLRAQDREFVQEVLQDHFMHVKLADLAQKNGRSDETRKLADRMEKNFTEYGQRWTELANRYGLKPTTHLGDDHQKKVDRLEKASKQNFDRTYATIVTEHLESVVPYFEKEGRDVQADAIRRLVNDELPVIRQDVNQARRLQTQASAQAGPKEKEKSKEK